MSRQMVTNGPSRGGRAGVEVQLGHDVEHVVLDGARADGEQVANYAIGVAVGEQAQDLDFTRAEAMGIGRYTNSIGISTNGICQGIDLGEYLVPAQAGSGVPNGSNRHLTRRRSGIAIRGCNGGRATSIA